MLINELPHETTPLLFLASVIFQLGGAHLSSQG